MPHPFWNQKSRRQSGKRRWPLSCPRALPGLLSLSVAAFLPGCGSAKHDPAAEAPPAAATLITAGDSGLVRINRPEQFPTVAAVDYRAVSSLNVTGQVQPDPSREIPVISLANGRVVAAHVRLGDFVQKGQLVLEVQSTDVSGAFNQYLKAVNDEHLTKVQLDRAQLLYDKGAIALSQLEIARDAEDDNLADLRAAEQQLHVLGVDPKHPSATVKVLAPASGFIVQQNVTEASSAGNGVLGTPNAFLIADLAHVWVICDVYENDLAQVRVGQTAEIRLSAFPGRVLKGTIGDVGAILDPNLRTGKVRVQVPNPGYSLRIGMFTTATFYGRTPETHAQVPATAILHLHDRDWVYVPATGPGTRAGDFRRQGVVAGAALPGGLQEVVGGLLAGQLVVRNALELQNTAAQ